MDRQHTQKLYLATRSHYPNAPACFVLEAIRGDGPRPNKYVPNVQSWRLTSPYNPPFNGAYRWIEDTDRAGLRWAGWADEICRSIQHRGWFSDSEFQSEVYRGAVWRLPGRNGAAVYVTGYADPCNDGAALIEFDPIYGERLESEYDTDSELLTAAYSADSIAERFAEDERRYSELWHAARRVEDTRSEICELRRKHTALIRAIWTGERDDAIGARLREQCRSEVAKLRKRIENQIDDYGPEILTDKYA